MSDNYSIGINRGGWYWCAKCGDIKGPCKHFPPLFQAASDLLAFVEKHARETNCICRVNKIVAKMDVYLPCTNCEAQALIQKAVKS